MDEEKRGMGKERDSRGYYLLTLGCPKNQVDSDLLESSLRRAGWKRLEGPADADVILVNTCSFIVPAVEESVEAVLELSDARKGGALLAVCGCLVSRYGKKTLAGLLPEVDLFVSPAEYPRLPSLLRQKSGSREILPAGAVERTCSSTLHLGYVYLKVSEGCHRRCTYCAIPRIRGPLVSRPLEDIVKEAAFFLRRGAREMVLVGQDTTSYGRDLEGRGCLPLLLRELCGLGGDYRLRVMYMHPEGVDEELLEAMRHPRVYPYFDLPFQHVDPAVLRAMGRKGDLSSCRGLVESIRSVFPEAALRATFMVGFPGEDAASFRTLLGFVEEARFDWLGLFGYSQEEGTPAYPLGKGADGKVKRDRLRRLSLLQEEIMREKARLMVGRVLRVLVEGKSGEAPGYWEARSYREAPEVDGVVFIPDHEALGPGRWCEVRVTAAEDIDLIALPVNASTARRRVTPSPTADLPDRVDRSRPE